jgi:signal peptidase II
MKKILTIASGVLFLDQVTKFAIRQTIHLGFEVEIIKDIFSLCHTKNPGILFGLFPNLKSLFLITNLIVILSLILFSLKTSPQDPYSKTGLGLIIGGGCGNLTDRLIFGGVIDFLSIGIGRLRWPAFNIADSSICIGLIILLLHCLGHKSYPPKIKDQNPL